MVLLKSYFVIAAIAFVLMLLPVPERGYKFNMGVYSSPEWWRCTLVLAILWPLTLCFAYNYARGAFDVS